MVWKALLSLAAAPFANALLRFPCSQLVTERFDPLVTPGQVSPHLHQIVGGNAFNISMDINNDLPALSTCTTCRFKEDFSNYWTAVLFFKHPNGSYHRVPQIANQYTGSPNGGMTVYYIQPPNGEKTTAFRKGFRMIVGNPMVRRDLGVANTATARALTHRCFGANFGGSVDHPGGPQDTVELPKGPCAGGIRSNIYFPSCWDGVNLDTPNHSSHVAWPIGNPGPIGNFFFGGTCPSTHPVRLPMLFVEIVWDTSRFNNMWPSDGSNPFVYSYGDPTGYGQHGDYVFGWEGDSLQRAMDLCTDMSGIPEQCRALTILNDTTINRCTKAAEVPEVTTGYLQALPGCNPIQTGPASATVPASCTAVTTTGPVPGEPTNPTNPGNPSNPTTTINPPTRTFPNPGQPTQTKWGQCGGQGWTGPTVCASGSTCQFSNQWYSQCI